MEVAGQWRREWAGTAEYGKVTEGGVTRRVARAMEVLNASGPGARVRVMRAAYHSTSAPGVPAASFMLHSSRRVISSGFNILESPTFPTQPLEISSTPLEYSPDRNLETENYKVTEPDDIDISEPSKWRATTGGSSIRMPSEESSSTDNASIIDLDSRFGRKGLYRKYSYDSENSDVHSLKRESARASPLLDTPVTLSTLKYKSLLNSSNDWNNRRKSYSFGDTSPLNEIIQSNDTLAMESSTDSGICKSSEIVNDFTEDIHNKHIVSREKRFNIQDTIDNWQRKNKLHSTCKSSKMKTYKEHDTVIEDPRENNIALQSSGKLTITVPMTIEGEDDDEYKKSYDDGDRKVKKVEFCKTELHFAAEPGRVNIIATDEKPPPTNDFRKRKSAFVPINEKFDKPITLFGEKSDFSDINDIDAFKMKDFSQTVEFDENTAATKSILKNKIPKPKPYLLGENMAFGNNEDTMQAPGSPAPIGVSLINKELQTNRISSNTHTLYNSANETRKESFSSLLRTIHKGPSQSLSSNIGKSKLYHQNNPVLTDPKPNNESIKGKFHVLQMSPVPKPKTRQLRESDLTYFGIAKHDDTPKILNSPNKTKRTENKSAIPWTDLSENTFESVRLIKKYSSSAQNSDAESTDAHDYQNIPLKTNFAPVPTPRSRAKYACEEDRGVILKPKIEQLYDSNKTVQQESRRSRSRKQDNSSTLTNRSLSAPAKKYNMRNTVAYSRHRYEDTRTTDSKKENPRQRKEEYPVNKVTKNEIHTNEDIPLYANVERRESHINQFDAQQAITGEVESKTNRKLKDKKDPVANRLTNTESNSLEKTKKSENRVKHRVQRTEKLSTPETSSTLIKGDKNKLKNNNNLDNSNSNSRSVKDNQFRNRQKLTKDTHSLMPNNDNGQIKESKYSETAKNDGVTKSNGNKLQDKNTMAPELSRSKKINAQKPAGYRTQSKSSTEKDGADRANNNTHGRRSSRRSEYVIKYDDKNGTVSSICKVRSGHSTPKKKHLSKERNKEYINDSKSRNTEKSALLQLPAHRIVNGRNEEKKWNAKVNVQRSCQLL